MMEYEIFHLKFIVSIWGIEYLIFQIIAIFHVLECLKFVQLSLSTSQDLSEEKNLIERMAGGIHSNLLLMFS